MSNQIKDVRDAVVIGGGAAGLNGALMLARARRSVTVIDAGSPRNATAAAIHGLLGREGTTPAEFLDRGRAEVRSYGGHVRVGTVTDVTSASLDPHDDAAVPDFTVTLEDGATIRARRLLIASGVVDELPDIPGLRDRWGRDVLHCPYCHGWEVRDQAIGVLATGPMSVHQALLFRQWSTNVAFFPRSASQPTEEQTEQLVARGVELIPGDVTAVETAADRLSGVRLSDGTLIERDALVVAPYMAARLGFLSAIGLRPTPHSSGMGEHIPTDPTGRTHVAGVWAAGNVADLTAQVGSAAAAGAGAGAQINADLVAEETAQAVTRRGQPHPTSR